MHDMSSFDKNKALFLRRKHKLYKSLAQPPPTTTTETDAARIDTARLYSAVLNKENQASQLDYFIKHELKADLTPCMPVLLGMLWRMLNIRCGRIISFVVYRLCRKYPGTYWSVVVFIGERLQYVSAQSPEQAVFLSDLILYGFAITADQFANQLFPHFQPHVLELLPIYLDLLQSNEFFPLRHQRVFLESFKAWMQEERVQLQALHDELLALSHNLQERLIGEEEDEQEQLYIRRLEIYQTQLFRFANAAQYLNEPVEMDNFKLKSIFELKKECRTFKLSFEYSQYQKSLYLKGQGGREVCPLRKSDMLRMEESDAFVTRVKLVCEVQECIELAGYFLEQMNTQHNREYLVQLIINDCYHYNNLPYVLKVAYHISLAEPSVIEYCCGKGRKICGQARMNQKYQKLLCEMSRFGLMDQNILLEYCEKALRVESSQSTREVQAILQHLGTMVYYRSLHTHTRINGLFELMQAMMKGKLVHFSIDQLFHLKGLLSYLRSHANKVVPEAQDMAALQIKTNFPFILKKMERLLKEQQVQKVWQFVAAGIDQQDFLNSYYYASLIKDLHHKPLNQQVHTLAFSSITDSLTQMDAQRSVCWSRFLGELYTYEIVGRRRLIEDLTEILQKYQQATTLTSSLKCICATLETSKYYLKVSEINQDQRQVICFLLDLKKVVCLNSLDQLLFDEIAELTEHFHPFLSQLDSLEKIYSVIELSELLQQRESIYAILDLMQNGVSIEELMNEQRPATKRCYAEKEKVHEKTHEKKWVEKPVRYRQKEPNSDHSHTLPHNTRESPSKLSIKTEQTRQGQVQKKQIKVMGRSRADKRVKVVTATYHSPTE